MKSIFFYTVGKYLNYLLLFVRGILLAATFDYATYASWGIVMYVLSYFPIFGLGIPNIVLTNLKDFEVNSDECAKLAGSSILFIIYLCGIYLSIVFLLQITSFLQLDIINYYVLTLLVALYLIVDVLRNVARYSNRYLAIWTTEFFAIIPLLLLLVFKPVEITLNLSVSVITISTLLGMFILLKATRVIFKINDFVPFVRLIWKLGIPLLLYNYASYLLFLILRYFVLYSYDDTTVANFNFGWLIANGVILGLNIINWYFYPSLLKNLSAKNDPKFRISQKEIFAIQFLIAAVVLGLIPLIFEFLVTGYFTKYQYSITHFKYLLTSQLIFYLAYYPSTLLVVEERNRVLIKSGLMVSGIFAITIWVNNSIGGQIELFLLYSLLIVSTILFYFYLSYSTIWKGPRLPFFISIVSLLLLGLINNPWYKIVVFGVVLIIGVLWIDQIKSFMKKIKYELGSI